MTQNPYEEQEDYEAYIRESFKPVVLSESVEDGTEGGYTVTEAIPAAELEDDPDWDLSDDAVRVKYIPAPPDDSGW